MSDTDKISKRLGQLESDMHGFKGHGTAYRQRQEYAAEHWNELYGMCAGLVNDIDFDIRNNRKKIANESDSIHGEAFAAGISGRCADCELDKELEAEIAKLKAKPVAEHPDVQRLVGQVVELQAEKEAVKTQYARDLVATNWAYFPKPVCKNQPPEITNGYNACLSCPMRKTCLLIFKEK